MILNDRLATIQEEYDNHCGKFSPEQCKNGECGLPLELCEAIGSSMHRMQKTVVCREESLLPDAM